MHPSLPTRRTISSRPENLRLSRPRPSPARLAPPVGRKRLCSVAREGKGNPGSPRTRTRFPTQKTTTRRGCVTSTGDPRNQARTVVAIDLYPSKEALGEAIATDSTGALPQRFEQLDEVLEGLVAEAGGT